MSHPALGLIANPVSARDIRRVVANAGNLQITDRVNIVLRVLQAAHAAGVTQALLMPDRGGIRALLERHLKRGDDATLPDVQWLDMQPESTVDDTFAATRLLLRAGVRVIVVLGGDGTHRAVVREIVAAKAHASVAIAGISTGTNNAFPDMREPTITGLAAGLYACGRIAKAEALTANKLVEVAIERSDTGILDGAQGGIADGAQGGIADGAQGATRRDVAIVDAVVTHDRTVGARALWKTASLDAAYLAFAEAQAIGLSSIGGLLDPVGRREPGGLAVQLASDDETPALHLRAPIAPGLVLPVAIAHWQRMAADQPMPVRAKAGTIALDGERELAFDHSDRVTMTLREGAFFTLDVARCMAVAARDGLLRQPITA